MIAGAWHATQAYTHDICNSPHRVSSCKPFNHLPRRGLTQSRIIVSRALVPRTTRMTGHLSSNTNTAPHDFMLHASVAIMRHQSRRFYFYFLLRAPQGTLSATGHLRARYKHKKRDCTCKATAPVMSQTCDHASHGKTRKPFKCNKGNQFGTERLCELFHRAKRLRCIHCTSLSTQLQNPTRTPPLHLLSAQWNL